MSSVGNLALTVTVARSTGVSTLGEFAVTMSVYVLLTGLVRAAVIDSILSLTNASDLFVLGVRRVSYLGSAAFIIMLVVAVILNSPYMIWLAISIHGILIYDFIKVYNMAVAQSLVAFRQETVWTLITGVFVGLGLAGAIGASTVFLGWAISCALIGYANGLKYARSITPSWPRDSEETRLAAIYSLDYMAGSGGAQLPTYFIAGLSGTSIVGALRGGGTIYGPFNLILTTGLALSIPHLAKKRVAGPAAELKAARLLTGLQVLILAPPAIVVALLPTGVYSFVLGSTGALIGPIMVPLAIELTFSVATTVAFAGHRAQRAGIRTLIVRGVMAPLRVVVVVIAAMHSGAPGAAWAMAGMAILGAVLWWWSYCNLVMAGVTRA